MRKLKKFENFVTESYEENKPDIATKANLKSDAKSELINHLLDTQDVYSNDDLEAMNIDQLTNLDRQVSNAKEEEEISESKRWIQDAVRKPGSLRRKLKKRKGETISSSEIDSELQALKSRDKDRRKPGLQLSKRDRTKHKELVLARTLKGLRETSFPPQR